MYIVTFYNFCPVGIEIANLMREIRKINGKSGIKLVKYEEYEEVRKRTRNACIRVKGNSTGKGPRTGPYMRRPKGCRLDCSTSYKTSILIYDNEPA